VYELPRALVSGRGLTSRSDKQADTSKERLGTKVTKIDTDTQISKFSKYLHHPQFDLSFCKKEPSLF